MERVLSCFPGAELRAALGWEEAEIAIRTHGYVEILALCQCGALQLLT